jgi:hypothetical protein
MEHLKEKSGELGEQRRKVLDQSPPGTRYDGLNREAIEIAVEDGLALLREGWSAVVLFFPHRLAVG